MLKARLRVSVQGDSPSFGEGMGRGDTDTWGGCHCDRRPLTVCPASMALTASENWLHLGWRAGQMSVPISAPSSAGVSWEHLQVQKQQDVVHAGAAQRHRIMKSQNHRTFESQNHTIIERQDHRNTKSQNGRITESYEHGTTE